METSERTVSIQVAFPGGGTAVFDIMVQKTVCYNVNTSYKNLDTVNSRYVDKMARVKIRDSEDLDRRITELRQFFEAGDCMVTMNVNE
jgi:hypothetical protein